MACRNIKVSVDVVECIGQTSESVLVVVVVVVVTQVWMKRRGRLGEGCLAFE